MKRGPVNSFSPTIPTILKRSSLSISRMDGMIRWSSSSKIRKPNASDSLCFFWLPSSVEKILDWAEFDVLEVGEF